MKRLFLVLTLLVPAAASAAGPALLPIDEAARQPDFFTFRARLQVALAEHDTAAVLALGGRFHGEATFVAPYVFASWPDTIDSFESVAVIGRHVQARAAPRADAKAIATLDFAIVPRANDLAARAGASSRSWPATDRVNPRPD